MDFVKTDPKDPEKESVDDVEGITSIKLSPFKPPEDEKILTTEEAIISFWRINEENSFRCMSSYNVPNPIKRQVHNFDNTVVNQVLFYGKQGELFYFYKEDIDKEEIKEELWSSTKNENQQPKQVIKIGILNKENYEEGEKEA